MTYHDYAVYRKRYVKPTKRKREPLTLNQHYAVLNAVLAKRISTWKYCYTFHSHRVSIIWKQVTFI